MAWRALRAGTVSLSSFLQHFSLLLSLGLLPSELGHGHHYAQITAEGTATEFEVTEESE